MSLWPGMVHLPPGMTPWYGMMVALYDSCTRSAYHYSGHISTKCVCVCVCVLCVCVCFVCVCVLVKCYLKFEWTSLAQQKKENNKLINIIRIFLFLFLLMKDVYTIIHVNNKFQY